MPLQTMDIFPKTLSSEAASFKFLDRSDVENCKRTCLPFIPLKESKLDVNGSGDSYYHSSIVKYHPLQQDLHEFLLERFDRQFNSSFFADNRSGHVNVPWNTIDSKLCRPPHLGHRLTSNRPSKKQQQQQQQQHVSDSTTKICNKKTRHNNADNRLGFVINQNCFLVKGNFTFGLRKPDAQFVISPERSSKKVCEVHIIKTTEAPLLLHIPKPRYMERILKHYRPGLFSAGQQDLFNTFVLPGGNHERPFLIPHGVPYILTAVQKTLFYLYRCTANMIQDLRYEHNVIFSRPDHPKLKFVDSPEKNMLSTTTTTHDNNRNNNKRKSEKSETPRSQKYIKSLPQVRELPFIPLCPPQIRKVPPPVVVCPPQICEMAPPPAVCEPEICEIAPSPVVCPPQICEIPPVVCPPQICEIPPAVCPPQICEPEIPPPAAVFVTPDFSIMESDDPFELDFPEIPVCCEPEISFCEPSPPPVFPAPDFSMMESNDPFHLDFTEIPPEMCQVPVCEIPTDFSIKDPFVLDSGESNFHNFQDINDFLDNFFTNYECDS